MEGRSHIVTDETRACFYISPITQLETDCSLCDVLATPLSEFPGSLRLLGYSNQYIFCRFFSSVFKELLSCHLLLYLQDEIFWQGIFHKLIIPYWSLLRAVSLCPSW